MVVTQMWPCWTGPRQIGNICFCPIQARPHGTMAWNNTAQLCSVGKHLRLWTGEVCSCQRWCCSHQADTSGAFRGNGRYRLGILCSHLHLRNPPVNVFWEGCIWGHCPHQPCHLQWEEPGHQDMRRKNKEELSSVYRQTASSVCLF